MGRATFSIVINGTCKRQTQKYSLQNPSETYVTLAIPAEVQLNPKPYNANVNTN